MRTLVPLLVMLSLPLHAQVLAQVNGETLTWEELVESAGGLEALRFMGIASESVAAQILESWVRERLVLAEARASGLLQRPDVQKAIQEATDQVLIEAYLEDLLDGIVVSRLEAENYLDIWRETYGREYKVRHILLDSRVLANSVRSRLSSGESFESLAATFSSCPSAREGGLLGWVRRGMTTTTFMEAVCVLEPGQVSEVVETGAGFHVIQLMEVRNLASPPAGASLMQLVQEEMLGTRQENAVMELLTTLRAGGNVVLYPQRLLERL